MEELVRDLTRSDCILRWYLAGIRLDAQFRVSLGGYVLWLVMVPLALGTSFWYVTSAEGRFDLASMDQPAAFGSHDMIAGLSFLGDTMVWPFFLLVPLLLILLRRASVQVARLVVGGNELVRQNDPAAFNAIADQARIRLRYRSRKWRALWGGALAFGLVLFAYNTVACLRADTWPGGSAAYDQLWTWLKPYASHQAVIKPDTVVITLKDPASFIAPCKDPAQNFCLPPGLSDRKLVIAPDRRHLSWSGPISADEQHELAGLWPGAEWQQAVQSLARQKAQGYVSGLSRPVEKWDTDLAGARWSWIATRVWVLLVGYAILPLAVFRVLNLLFTSWRFATSLARADMLKANPYDGKSRQSLDLIVSALFAANYCLLVVSLMVALALVKVGASPGWHDLILLPFIPLFAFAAVAPLLSISSIFEHRVKQHYLSVHATAAGVMHQAFHDEAATMTTDARGTRADAIMKYGDYLSLGQDTAIFPISLTTVTGVVAPVAPLVLALVEKAIGVFF